MKVFDVVDGEAQRSSGQTLKGYVARCRVLGQKTEMQLRHTGPVWQVSWAHPNFGHILASCSYDGKVIIWKEQSGQGQGSGSWTKINEHTLHVASGEEQYMTTDYLLILLQSIPFAGHLTS